MKKIKIKNEEFNIKNPLIIAEVGQSHEGSEGLAHSMIDYLYEVGCQAIKFQIHLSEYESSLEDQFRVNFSYEDKNRFEYWKRIEFKKEQWVRLLKHCKKKQMLVGASVFSLEALEIINSNELDFIKIGSGDLQFKKLINQISKLDIPVIVSSGMANWDELKEIKTKFRKHIKNNKFSILHCTTEYPTSPENIGFNNVKLIEDKFGIPSGLSEHSGNKLTAYYALAKGCTIIETHVTFDKKMFGPDSSSSLIISDFGEIIKAKNYFQKLNTQTNKDTFEEKLKATKIKFARSVGIKKNIKKGQTITKNDIVWRKPGGYLNEDDLKNVIGKKAKYNLDAKNILKKEDIE
tara:strand:- start:1790 stop:2833 length:1044 start_codon:yes stop_codon:yes gene_type:complete